MVRDIADGQPYMVLPDDGQTITVYARKSRVVLFIVQITLIGGAMTALLLWVDKGSVIGLTLGAVLDVFIIWPVSGACCCTPHQPGTSSHREC